MFGEKIEENSEFDPDQGGRIIKKYISDDMLQRLINELKDNGVRVIIKEDVIEHFAVIDNHLVWHGGMNLLGKEDAWDNLMRVKSTDIAEELMEMIAAQHVKYVP